MGFRQLWWVVLSVQCADRNSCADGAVDGHGWRGCCDGCKRGAGGFISNQGLSGRIRSVPSSAWPTQNVPSECTDCKGYQQARNETRCGIDARWWWSVVGTKLSLQGGLPSSWMDRHAQQRG